MILELTLEDYLEQVRIPIRLSCISTSGWPIVLSLWYLHEGGFFYCATPKRAKVVQYLTAEPRCGFEIAADQPPYCGVRGRAKATVDEERGIEILERLLVRYLGNTDNELAKRLLDRSQKEVAIQLAPESYHTWNFGDRMADIVPNDIQKICPA